LKLSPKGLTLAEVIVAFAVGSIAITTVALMLASVWRAASEGKYQAAASNLGRLSVEKLRGDPVYLNTTIAANAPAFINTTLSVDGVINTTFQSQINVQPLAGSPGYFDVTVNVTWAQEHRHRLVTMETYLPQL
jgi:Tfp pilus assembly protein PilV